MFPHEAMELKNSEGTIQGRKVEDQALSRQGGECAKSD